MIAFPVTAFAQFDDFNRGVDKMVAAMGNLTVSVSDTGDQIDAYAPELIDMAHQLSDDLHSYAPQIIDIGQNLTEQVDTYAPDFLDIGDRLSQTLQDLSWLAEDNAPQAQDSLKTGADALSTIADFATALRKNKVSIAIAATGVLASGVVIGQVLSKHVLTLDKSRNVFCLTFFAGRWLFIKTRALVWRRNQVAAASSSTNSSPRLGTSTFHPKRSSMAAFMASAELSSPCTIKTFLGACVKCESQVSNSSRSA